MAFSVYKTVFLEYFIKKYIIIVNFNLFKIHYYFIQNMQFFNRLIHIYNKEKCIYFLVTYEINSENIQLYVETKIFSYTFV